MIRSSLLVGCTAVALAAGAALPALAGEIVISIAPPPVRYEVAPPDRPGYVWAPGYWGWRNGRHVWVQGSWARTRPGFIREPATWVERDGRWVLRPGGWRLVPPPPSSLPTNSTDRSNMP